MCAACSGSATDAFTDQPVDTDVDTEPPLSGCAVGEPPSLQVGKGEDSFVASDETEGRTILIHGTQGGYHSFVSLRAEHLDLSDMWTYTLKGFLDGEELAIARPKRMPACNPEADAGEVNGTWLIWRSHPSVLHGREVVIQAVVKDPLGNEVQSQTTQTVWDEREWD